jgi:hypothetical protein
MRRVFVLGPKLTRAGAPQGGQRALEAARGGRVFATSSNRERALARERKHYKYRSSVR